MNSDVLPVYTRRVRIECANGVTGHAVKITDLDTGESVPQVISATIYLNPVEVNVVELTCLVTDDRGTPLQEGEGEDARPIERKIYVNNPEVDLLAYERRRV